jgi:hypothetical protein
MAFRPALDPEGCFMGATFRFLRYGVGLLLAGAATAALAANGLSVSPSPTDWPRWQPRLELTNLSGTRLGPTGTDASPTLRAALLGDYDLGDFGLALPGTLGRFRATSGLIFGLKGPAATLQPWAVNDSLPPSAPYIGLGYTGWLARTGLSFTADVGLTADYPGGTWRLGRALLGNQGSDATLRELRLQPRLQLGMQYSY